MIMVLWSSSKRIARKKKGGETHNDEATRGGREPGRKDHKTRKPATPPIGRQLENPTGNS
jgi:hypothetical protein